jgi:hypothetical protein
MLAVGLPGSARFPLPWLRVGVQGLIVQRPLAFWFVGFHSFTAIGDIFWYCRAGWPIAS